MEELQSVEACVDAIVERVGKDLRVAAPLAIGKPNHLLNALYARAKADPELKLTLFTALTLERPKGTSDLERRFLGPMVERVFGDYPDLDYELDRVRQALPDNVRVVEFYFPAGKYMRNEGAQRDYISSNYTHVARDLLDRGVNVLAQMVARAEVDGRPMISLGSNPDVAPDLMRAMRQQAAQGKAIVFAAQHNRNMPFMFGEALMGEDSFHLLVDNPEQHFRLFAPPRMSVADADYMIGLYASTLIKDGGELQIGIGALGDAIVYNLLLRNEDNREYQQALERFKVKDRFGPVIERLGETSRFEKGLFSASEMLVDGFMHLYKAGIVKRRVYDHLVLQRLLNEGEISEVVNERTLSLLHERRAVHAILNDEDFAFLQRFGILRAGLRFDKGQIVLEDGTRLLPDVADAAPRARIAQHCLGERLEGGAVIHAGFFLGPQEFYDWLIEMPEAERKGIRMRSVSRINQLYGHEALDRLHRKDARFVNTGMMVTLSGAVVSDGLEDGSVVSGVGGQYNFVAMAHALPDGHSVLQVRSTRHSKGQLHSNVVWNYGHVTIPRHLRDVIITEYGIADLRGKTDEEVIQQLLNVTDSHFQDELMEQAKKSGKLSADYEIPEIHRNNTAEAYEQVLAGLKSEGLFAPFPFGTDLTDDEIVLGRALKGLRAKVERTSGTLEALADAVVDGSIHQDVLPYLKRMDLDNPQTLKETLYQRLLAAELRNEGVGEPS